MIPAMASRTRALRHRAAGPSTPLKARVTPEHKALAEAGATARGVSLARYVEILIEQDEIARRALEAEQAEQRCA